MQRFNLRTLDEKASIGPAEGNAYHRLSSQASESHADGTDRQSIERRRFSVQATKASPVKVIWRSWSSEKKSTIHASEEAVERF